MSWHVLIVCGITLALASDHGVVELGEEMVQACPVSAWGGAGGCSLKCGGGMRTWRRAVTAGSSGCRAPALLRTTPCNTHACDGGSARPASPADTEARRKADAGFETKKNQAHQQTLSALGQAFSAVRDGKAGANPLERAEYKELVRRNEDELHVSEAHAKSHLKQQHSAHSQHAAAIKPPVKKSATTFSHSYLYQDKIQAGEIQLKEAKEVTTKVRKEVKANPRQPKGKPVHPDDRYRTEFAKGARAYKKADWRQAKLHYRRAVAPELGEGGPTQHDFRLAKQLLNSKLEAVSERRIKLTGDPEGQVHSVKEQIDGAVAQAYKKANEGAQKNARSTVSEVKSEAKHRVAQMKAVMEAKVQENAEAMAAESSKIHKLEQNAEKVASTADSKINRLINDKAKKAEKLKLRAIENNLAAQTAVKHAKVRLAAAQKEAYLAGMNAARSLKNNGSPHDQKMADDNVEETKDFVLKMQDQLKLTQKLVTVSPSSGPSVKAAEDKASQEVATETTKAKLIQDKCSEAKTAVQRSCAVIEQDKAEQDKAADKQLKKEAAKKETAKEVAKQKKEKEKKQTKKPEKKQKKEKEKKHPGPRVVHVPKTEKKQKKGAEPSLMASSLFLLQKGQAAALDKQSDFEIQAAQNDLKANKSRQDKLAQAAGAVKACSKARKKQAKWCSQAKAAELAAHNAKVRAAGDVAATAKYKAARIASDEAKGSATKEEMMQADERAEGLKKKFLKLQAQKFQPVEQAAPVLAPGHKKLIEEMISAGIAAAISAGKGANLMPASSKLGKSKSKAAKLLKKEGNALLEKNKEQGKLVALTKQTQKDAREMAAAVKYASDALAKAPPAKKKAAEHKLSKMMLESSEAKVASSTKLKAAKTAVKADKVKSDELKKKEHIALKTEDSIKTALVTKSKAKAVETAVAKVGAKMKLGAYKAGMKAAKVAALESKKMASQAELFAADTASDAANKASDAAANSAKFVFKCNSGRSEIAAVKTKLVGASGTARAKLTSQLTSLVKETEQACAKSKKKEKASQKAIKTAKQDEKISDKQMKEEQKKAVNSASDPTNPLIKRDWKVVTKGQVITASVTGVFNQTAVLEAQKAKRKKAMEDKQREDVVLLQLNPLASLYPATYGNSTGPGDSAAHGGSSTADSTNSTDSAQGGNSTITKSVEVKAVATPAPNGIDIKSLYPATYGTNSTNSAAHGGNSTTSVPLTPAELLDKFHAAQEKVKGSITPPVSNQHANAQ